MVLVLFPGTAARRRTGRYNDIGDHLHVGTEFTAKNSFGARQRHIVEAKVGLDGTVIEITAWE